MAEWNRIFIDRKLIKAESGKSVKIVFPQHSDYGGYSVWLSKKLVRDTYYDDVVSISYTEDFKFKIKKYCRGRFNKFELADEKEITAAEFEKAILTTEEDIPLLHTPEILTPEKTEALEELKDD